MAGRLPVHPATRIGVGIVGGFLGVVPGVVLGQVRSAEVPALVAAAVGAVFGAARGAAVAVWLNQGEIRFRNLWRTYRFDAASVVRLDELRTQGMLKATNPALVIRGRRSRLPMHAAMLWGGFFSSDWTEGDRQRARLLRAWADRNDVPVAGVVQEMTEPPRPRRWTRLTRRLRSRSR